MKTAPWRINIMIIMMLTAFCCSCSLFDPREAEAPGGAGSTFQVPDFPTKVFLNMQSGLEELTGTNYELSLHDAFTFVPLPQDVASLGPEVFENWTSDVEKDVVQRMLANASEIEVEFTDLEVISSTSGFADYRALYDLRVFSITPQDTVSYKGKAQFNLQEGSRGWQLIRWEDLEFISGFASWGFLRGTLRQL